MRSDLPKMYDSLFCRDCIPHDQYQMGQPTGGTVTLRYGFLRAARFMPRATQVARAHLRVSYVYHLEMTRAEKSFLPVELISWP